MYGQYFFMLNKYFMNGKNMYDSIKFEVKPSKNVHFFEHFTHILHLKNILILLNQKDMIFFNFEDLLNVWSTLILLT